MKQNNQLSFIIIYYGYWCVDVLARAGTGNHHWFNFNWIFSRCFSKSLVFYFLSFWRWKESQTHKSISNSNNVSNITPKNHPNWVSLKSQWPDNHHSFSKIVLVPRKEIVRFQWPNRNRNNIYTIQKWLWYSSTHLRSSEKI